MTTYKEAGVDVEKKNILLKKLKEQVKSTFDSRVLASPTLFKSLLFNASELKKFDEPMLAFNADGVGTKTAVAEATGNWNGIGFDIVNHCINDILTMGARPLCFTDYIASDNLKPEVVEAVVKSVAECCRQNGIIFVGGETAEMPKIYNPGTSDVAGFIVGAVEKSKVIDGKNIREGDVLIGLASTGLHTNGFSLARKAVADCGLDFNQFVPKLKMSIGEALLTSHRNYLKATMVVMENHKIKGIAHITGGSFKKNLPRILPEGLGAQIERKAWKPLPIFELISEWGKVPADEMYNTFNMGIGYVYAVSPNEADDVLKLLKGMKEQAHIIGKIVKGSSVRYVD
jgi:phosphoribosylformylglycinamidine cyclo-ligase